MQSIQAVGKDLNLGRIASNFLQDVPLQSKARGNTGDMQSIAITYNTNHTFDHTWDPVNGPDPGGHYPAEATTDLDLRVAGQTNNVDTTRLGAGFQIAVARKPTLDINYQDAAGPVNLLYAGMAYVQDQSKLFYADNIDVTPQVRSTPANPNTNTFMVFNVTFDSTPP